MTRSLLLADGGTFWLPALKSTFEGVDQTFYFIFWICVLFFFLILCMAGYFLVKYSHRGRVAEVPRRARHNTMLELIWSGIPLFLVLIIFVMGFRSYMDLITPPEDAYEIQVNAQKWNWSFTYPNGYIDTDLHVPAGEPVKLIMSSQDVIHSFFVPELRTKQDVVPGRYTQVWFEAVEPFEATVFCTEYCGTNHSQMQSRFIAQTPDEYAAWLEKASRWWEGMAPEEAGEVLYTRRGCDQCHSIDGSGGIGPTFLGAFGNRRQLSDGGAATMDENYIRESLLAPRAKVVAGFDPVMPTFQGRLKEEELGAIIAYIKSLSGG